MEPSRRKIRALERLAKVSSRVKTRGVLINLTSGIAKKCTSSASASPAVDGQKAPVARTEGWRKFRQQIHGKASVRRNFNGSPVHGRRAKIALL
jgi:hypothetical protein